MRTRLAIFGAAALLLVSACAAGTASPDHGSASAKKGTTTAAKAATVHLPKSYKFSPDVVEVASGAVVTWINEDDFPHTVHLLDGSGVDKKIGVGESTRITFDEPGTYRYDCSLHPTQMKGEVVVRDVTS